LPPDIGALQQDAYYNLNAQATTKVQDTPWLNARTQFAPIIDKCPRQIADLSQFRYNNSHSDRPPASPCPVSSQAIAGSKKMLPIYPK
jgi:hypothetical protein